VDANLINDLMEFITQQQGDDEQFNALALRLFAYQYQNNTMFQKVCQQRGKTLRMVRHWHDIPAVPINAFKELTLSCEPVEKCQRVFMTSGTTRGEVKGKHYHPNLKIYDASMEHHFQKSVMKGHSQLPMAVLFPDENIMPNSSLAHYLANALKQFGAPGSGYYLDENGLKTDAFIGALTKAQTNAQPIIILAASYSLVHLMDALDERNLKFKLPAGSKVMDTGGFKGQSREMPAADFYSMLVHTLGVDLKDCINMYGMTELSSQFYDQGQLDQPAIKQGPHWMRTRVLDPLSGIELPDGEQGILAHTDLANFNSVITILTEDVGYAVHNGFALLGRAKGSQAKGCSMAVDEFLMAARS
jgi:phenylacetate-coenzyme A ligase PaaK-like adenylate-forming protein